MFTQAVFAMQGFKVLVGNNYTAEGNDLYKVGVMRKALQDGERLMAELQVSRIIIAGDGRLTQDLLEEALQSAVRGEWEVLNAASRTAFFVANCEIRPPLARPQLAMVKGNPTPQVAQMPLRHRGANSARVAASCSGTEDTKRQAAIAILDWLQERRARDLDEQFQRQVVQDDEAAELRRRLNALLEQKRDVDELIVRWCHCNSPDGAASASSRDQCITREDELLACCADLLDHMAEDSRQAAAGQERVRAAEAEELSAVLQRCFGRVHPSVPEEEALETDTATRASDLARLNMAAVLASKHKERVKAEVDKAQAVRLQGFQFAAELARRKLRVEQELREFTANMPKKPEDKVALGSAMALSECSVGPTRPPQLAAPFLPTPAIMPTHAAPGRPVRSAPQPPLSSSTRPTSVGAARKCQCHRSPGGHQAVTSPGRDIPRGWNDEAWQVAASLWCRPSMDHMFRIPKNDGTGAWRFSREIAVDEVTQVLRWRAEALQDQMCDIMPIHLQKLGHRQYFQDWLDDPANAKAVRTAVELHRGQKRIKRDLNSLHRVYCHERFGGREWIYLLIAFGQLDEDIWLSAQEAFVQCHQRRKDKQSAPSAPSRGQILRAAAKCQQSKLDEVNAQWEAGDRSMSYKKWWELEHHVKYLWEEARDADGVSRDVDHDDEDEEEDGNSFVSVACQRPAADSRDQC